MRTNRGGSECQRYHSITDTMPCLGQSMRPGRDGGRLRGLLVGLRRRAIHRRHCFLWRAHQSWISKTDAVLPPIARERLHVLDVNHHLRGKASDGDEAFVRELCAQYGLPLCVEHAYFDGESGNIRGRGPRSALCRGAEVCSRRALRPDGGAANGGWYLHRAHVFGSRGNVFDERD